MWFLRFLAWWVCIRVDIWYFNCPTLVLDPHPSWELNLTCVLMEWVVQLDFCCYCHLYFCCDHLPHHPYNKDRGQQFIVHIKCHRRGRTFCKICWLNANNCKLYFCRGVLGFKILAEFWNSKFLLSFGIWNSCWVSGMSTILKGTGQGEDSQLVLWKEVGGGGGSDQLKNSLLQFFLSIFLQGTWGVRGYKYLYCNMVHFFCAHLSNN